MESSEAFNIQQELLDLDAKLDELRALDQVFPEVLYHYTSADGLKGIIVSGEFRATSVYHLNDSSEIEHGFGVANKVLSRMIEASEEEPRKRYFTRIKSSLSAQTELISLYVVCFCKEDNLLSMWRAYASKGYCIGIRCDGIRPRLKPFSIFTIDESDPSISLEKVEYGLEQQENLIVQLMEESLGLHDKIVEDESRMGELAARVAHQIIRSLARFKQSAFEPEQEWRLVKYFAVGLEKEDAKFREVNGLLVPYVEVDSFQMPDSKLPIQGIRFGPSLPAGPTEKAIGLLLFAQGYDDSDIPIQESGISLRWS